MTVAIRRVRRRRRPATTFIPRGSNLERRLHRLMEKSAVPQVAQVLAHASCADQYASPPLSHTPIISPTTRNLKRGRTQFQPPELHCSPAFTKASIQHITTPSTVGNPVASPSPLPSTSPSPSCSPSLSALTLDRRIRQNHKKLKTCQQREKYDSLVQTPSMFTSPVAARFASFTPASSTSSRRWFSSLPHDKEREKQKNSFTDKDRNWSREKRNLSISNNCNSEVHQAHVVKDEEHEHTFDSQPVTSQTSDGLEMLLVASQSASLSDDAFKALSKVSQEK